MNDIDTLIAKTQAKLAFLFGVAFIFVLLMLIFVLALWALKVLTEPPTSILSLLTGLLGVFGTIVTLQQNYFFARHRPPTAADNDDDGGNGAPPNNAPVPNGVPLK
jgi:energy-coupling factor transporter transmembrane protein EcfT